MRTTTKCIILLTQEDMGDKTDLLSYLCTGRIYREGVTSKIWVLGKGVRPSLPKDLGLPNKFAL